MQLHDSHGHRLYLTADERRAIMVAAEKAERPVRTLCAVLHDTGCRISEALALNPAQIDLGGRAVIREPEEAPQGRLQGRSRAILSFPLLRCVQGFKRALGGKKRHLEHSLQLWVHSTAR